MPGQDPDHPFQRWLWEAPGTLNADHLAGQLRQMPRQLLRAKGWVRTDRHGLVLVQWAGRRVRYDTQAAPPDGLGATGLVFIGLRDAIDPRQVSAMLAPATAS
ncbi:hypothetical protein G6F31_017729 [Rhizopus arrhizus]|nr:hypothetical protein G6F31_017729 [Rhizopus arrhizus]